MLCITIFVILFIPAWTQWIWILENSYRVAQFSSYRIPNFLQRISRRYWISREMYFVFHVVLRGSSGRIFSAVWWVGGKCLGTTTTVTVSTNTSTCSAVFVVWVVDKGKKVNFLRTLRDSSKIRLELMKSSNYLVSYGTWRYSLYSKISLKEKEKTAGG